MCSDIFIYKIYVSFQTKKYIFLVVLICTYDTETNVYTYIYIYIYIYNYMLEGVEQPKKLPKKVEMLSQTRY